MPRYARVDPKADLPAMEERILAFWRDAGIFAKSVELRRDAPEWVFYEGPPTANGVPGIHHVEPRTFKDLYLRFRTMTGYWVPRKAGWDCHGLPVELEVEKEIGTTSKRDIEAFGIAEFNRRCRESVGRYVKNFEALTERIGFWIDMDDAYQTMDTDYILSVWWCLKEMHGKGLLFQDDKVTPYCPRCGTGLSDHEVAQGYAQTEDPSIYVRFPILSGPLADEGADLLIWTTMPWTLVPTTLAVVGESIRYVMARGGRAGDRSVVLAAGRIEEALGEGAAIVRDVTLAELVGARYRGPFGFVGPGSADDPDGDPASWRFVVVGDFVKSDEGTGVVHTSAAFGEDDMRVAREHGMPVVNPVDTEGRFDERVTAYARMNVRDADARIIDDLRGAGLLVGAGTYTHTFPFCWRCKTPLIYYARPAWYVRTTARKQALLDANEGTNWYPDHIKHGRYGDWLENNVDWSLSRERYWGTPLPIWRCGREHVTVVGSLTELSALAGRDVTGVDPHRPDIDEITMDCPECGGEARRVPEVADTWFDSGAMPFAQWGYAGPGSPGEETFIRTFPADFIVEAIDQTRGWFYALMAESVLLFGENSYRNVVCLGHIVDAEGRKMSKSLGNAVDPWEVISRFGSDAMRWFFVASGSPWSSRRVTMEAFDDIVRRLLLTLWNTYAFFVTYASIDEPDLSAAPARADRPALDRWVLSCLNRLVADVTEAMDAFDATGAGRRIMGFVDDLSNWYVRRSRRRFWDPSRSSRDGDGAADKLAAYATLEECLVTLAKLMAPFTPFVTEELYRNLVAAGDPGAPPSVHLTDYPLADPAAVDDELERAMELARGLVSLGRTVRTDLKVRVRQPLAHAMVHVPGDPSLLDPLLPLIAGELNVKQVLFAQTEQELAGWRAKPNFRALGPRLGPRVQEVAAALAADDGTIAARLAAGSDVELTLPSGEVALAPSDVDLVQQSRAGWGLATEGPLALALELELTDDLRREGLARELVHHVQALRKAAGLGVSDRIALAVDAVAGGPVARAIEGYGQDVAAEVLATRVQVGSMESPEGEATVSIEDERVTLRIRRTAADARAGA